MSNDPGPYSPPPPENRRGSKVWVFLGIGCTLMLLLCCGTGGLLWYGVQQNIAATEDPEAAAKMGRDIAQVDLPPQLQPSGGVKVTIPFTNRSLMTIVVYQDPQQGSSAFLAQFPVDFNDADPENMRLQMQQQVQKQRSQQSGGFKQLREIESHSVEITIRGQKSPFTIQRAEEREGGKEYWQVFGAFKGNDGTAMIMLQLPADHYTEEDAEKIIRSIK